MRPVACSQYCGITVEDLGREGRGEDNHEGGLIYVENPAHTDTHTHTLTHIHTHTHTHRAHTMYTSA